MARPGTRAFSTSGTNRASVFRKRQSEIPSGHHQERSERPDEKYAEHESSAAGLFPIEPPPSPDHQHDERHDPEPADLFDAIEAGGCIEAAHCGAENRVKGIPETNAARSTPRGALRQKYTWLTYRTDTATRNAWTMSGSDVTANTAAAIVSA